jgi:Flp pilus assembly protein TadD
MGEKNNAINDFSKSIEIAPNRPWGYSKRGQIYLELGQTEQAMSDYKAAAKLGDSGAQMFLKSKRIKW